MQRIILSRWHLTLVATAVALAVPAAARTQQHFPATEDVEHMLRYLVEDGETPGIVLAFIDAGGG